MGACLDYTVYNRKKSSILTIPHGSYLTRVCTRLEYVDQAFTLISGKVFAEYTG